MKIEEWVFTGLDIALKAGKTVDDLCLFLKTADGLRQIMGVTEFKQTNAGRIRSMMDEELAKFLLGFDECDTTIGSGYSTTYYSQHFCTAPCGGDDTTECIRCITEWLKQEVQE